MLDINSTGQEPMGASEQRATKGANKCHTVFEKLNRQLPKTRRA